MVILDTIVDLLLSWRLYVGFAVTVLICWFILQFIPNDALSWVICTPVCVAGLVLTFCWQARADFDE
jgi:uncharacterized membrane protein YfcA